MTKKQLEAGRRNLLSGNLNSEVQRRRRNKCLEIEQGLANELKGQGWEIFSPTAVCDRIGVKDGKVYFVEFKKRGQELKDGQQRIQNLQSNNYKIVYYS